MKLPLPHATPTPSAAFAARGRDAEPMLTPPRAAYLAAAVARLHADARCTADRIVARALAARQFGATADAYRAAALELDRQADRAETLLFGQVVETFRAAAVENRLMADALDAVEGERGEGEGGA